MKRVLVMVCLLLIVGCTSKDNDEKTIKVLSPFGAPSIALLQQIKEHPESITLVAGTDLLLAELVRPTPEYDLIIAPITMGVSLINNQQTNTKLLAIVSWGNLYIVGHQNALSNAGDSLAMFGKDQVPEKITNFVFDKEPIQAKQQYVASVLDAQAQLLTNKVQAALLAEPFVSKTLMENSELSILLDIQDSYYKRTGLENYPQAALFVNEAAYNEDPSVFIDYVKSLSEYIELIHADNSILLDDIKEVGAKELGLMDAEIVVMGLERMNLDVVFAINKKLEIQKFMELFDTEVTDDVMVDANEN